MAAPGGSARLSYIPEPYERPYYDALFDIADVRRQGVIGGAEAVQFLSKSQLTTDLLKNVWTIADQPTSNNLDKPKFAVAVRLIQLMQNNTKGNGPSLAAPEGVTLRPVMFHGVSGVSVPFPQQQQPQQQQAPPPPAQQQQQQQQEGVAPSPSVGGPPRGGPTNGAPPQPGAGGPPSMHRPSHHPGGPAGEPHGPSHRGSRPPSSLGQPSHAGAPSQRSMSISESSRSYPGGGALVTQDPYTLSPSDQSRYEAIFPEYAKPDGYVYGKEAVELFSRSGMEKSHLAAIWNMVDSPVDNRLDKLEFAMAMHLIVCVSKKNMPLPPALPPVLKQLKSQEPPPPPQQSQQPPPPQQPQPQQPQPPVQNSHPHVMQQQQQPPHQLSPISPVLQQGPPPLPSPEPGMMQHQINPPPLNHVQQQQQFSQPPPLPAHTGGQSLDLPSPNEFAMHHHQDGGGMPPSPLAPSTGFGGPPPAVPPIGGGDMNADSARTMEPTPRTTNGMDQATSTKSTGGGGQPGGFSNLPGPPAIQPQGGVSISDAFEGLSTNSSSQAMGFGNTTAAGGSGFGFNSHNSVEDSPVTSNAASFEDAVPEPLPGAATGFGFSRNATVAGPQPPETNMSMSTPLPTQHTEKPKTVQQLASSYKVGEANEELEKLKAVMQRLQAENISLKAQLGTMTDEEKDIQRQLGATAAEIGRLSNDLTNLRAGVLASKAKLLEASAELKASKEKEGVISDLIAEASATKDAIDEATRGIVSAREAALAVQQAPAPAPAIAEADLFGFGAPPAMSNSTDGASLPPPISMQQNEHQTTQASVSSASTLDQPPPTNTDDVPGHPVPQSNSGGGPFAMGGYGSNHSNTEVSLENHLATTMDPSGAGHVSLPAPPHPSHSGNQRALQYPAPAGPNGGAAYPPAQSTRSMGSQQPVLGQQQPLPGPASMGYPGFGDDAPMGGAAAVAPPVPSPLDAHNSSPAPAAAAPSSPATALDSTATMQNCEELKKKLRDAENVANDAEATRVQLVAQADELRRLADEAERASRDHASQNEGKKKGMFGRGKKKDAKETEKLAQDARKKKDSFLQSQTHVNDATAFAKETRGEVERLRNQLEEAEISAASAASMQQPQQQPQPQQAATTLAPPATNGFSSAPEQQQLPPLGGGDDGGYPKPQFQPNSIGFSSNVMGSGNDFSIPSPAGGGGGGGVSDPYENPFSM